MENKTKKTILTEKDYNDFYKIILFGKIENPINTSVKRAYRDLCRTIVGFSKNYNHDKILNNAIKLLNKEIQRLIYSKIEDQDDFDNWHKKCCDELIITFENQKFYYGQAQKWINMSLKYLSMIDHESVEKNYEYFHVPIDNYIIDISEIKTSVAWSRITDYSEYLDWQRKFRTMYLGNPLDNEFKLWLKVAMNV